MRTVADTSIFTPAPTPTGTRYLLAHEWLEETGGSENVFERITELLPGSRRVCLWNNARERFTSEVTESWLARTPIRGRKALSVPFMPLAWRSIDLSSIDSVVASSHAMAHQLATHAARQGRAAHVYVHSPARYLWATDHDPRGRSLAARLGGRPLRAVDRRLTSPQVSYAANSDFVRQRIERAWDVPSRVIHPAVETERLRAVADWAELLAGGELRRLTELPPDFVLGASRLISYKRLDAVIEAGQAVGLPVVVAGSGPEEQRLRELAARATVPVHFVGRVSDPMLYSLYARAALFVFLAVEDFGIMPVEAAALGTRLLVNAIGGTSEIAALVGGTTVADVESRAELKASAERALAADAPDPQHVGSVFSAARFASEFLDFVGN